MEKVLLLQILDSSWMEHLRAMDHLRSSVGLQGYAQKDPKVEYKQEGMKIFAEMWSRGLRQGDRPGLPRRAVRPRVPLVPRRPLATRPGADDPPVGYRRNWPRRRPPVRRSRPSKRPGSPPASRPASGSRSRSATSAKKSAGTTPAPAGLVKSSKPAACGRRRRATSSERDAGRSRARIGRGVRPTARRNDLRRLGPSSGPRTGRQSGARRAIGRVKTGTGTPVAEVVALDSIGRARDGHVATIRERIP